ncbi:hypothetical protein [Ammoniphilus resinae]|uniref:Uncharacterized protein n=1 Tax=Ammoniphilus resinae TaxID=861532 RepID=A0ABS4GT67_9BACL|nr:hypothetical protein [Ammoniphilus resinae]MBP1933449.1 hypothetical protein [Ammoniphilus resinae]
MDKRKVIEAYYRGLLTTDECAQVLGTNQEQIAEMLIDSKPEISLGRGFSAYQTEQA